MQAHKASITGHSEYLIRRTRLGKKIQNSRQERDPNTQPNHTEGHLQMTSGSAPKDSIARCDNGQGAATMSQEARNSRGRAPWRGRTRRPGRQPSRPRRRLAARREPLKEGTMAPRRVWARRRAPAAGAEGARTHRSPGGEGRPAPGARRAPGPRAPRTAQTSLPCSVSAPRVTSVMKYS